MNNRNGFLQIIGIVVVAAILIVLVMQIPKTLKVGGGLKAVIEGATAILKTGTTTSVSVNVPTPLPIGQASTTISYAVVMRWYETLSKLAPCKDVITPDVVMQLSKLNPTSIQQLEAWGKDHPALFQTPNLACEEAILSVIHGAPATPSQVLPQGKVGTSYFVALGASAEPGVQSGTVPSGLTLRNLNLGVECPPNTTPCPNYLFLVGTPTVAGSFDFATKDRSYQITVDP